MKMKIDFGMSLKTGNYPREVITCQREVLFSMRNISLLGMAGIIPYLLYQISFNGTIQEAMTNVALIVLLYNSLLIIGGNIKHQKRSKGDIVLSLFAFVMKGMILHG